MMRAAACSLIALALAGCPDPSPTGDTTTGALASGSAASTASASVSAAASAATSPTASATPPKPYEGPTGTLRGVVKVTGDEPPLTNFRYPKECEGAAGVYGKLFRVGQDGQLADAVVTVTHYEGFVPAKSNEVELTIKDCAYSQRTVVLTDGQQLAVRNLDALTSYIPHLDGARLPATMVAVPRGEPVSLSTRGLGRYWLRDQMGRSFMVAHVFHLPFSTATVTGLDGRYVIEGIPVGKAKLGLMLPMTRDLKTKTQDIEVKEGDNVFDLTLEFDAAKDTPADGSGNTKPHKPFVPRK